MRKRTQWFGTFLLAALAVVSGYWLTVSPHLTGRIERSNVASRQCDTVGINRYTDISYQQNPQLKLDIYSPINQIGCGASPLIVWIHGGGFTGGTYKLEEDKIRLFTQSGWAVASIQYELAIPGKPVYMPKQLEQVATAVGWLNTQTDRYNVNSENIVVAGFSAGAYLATMLAVNPDYVEAKGVNANQLSCAISIDTGAYDLRRYAASDDEAVPLYKAIIPNVNTYATYSPLKSIKSGQYVPRMLLVTRGEGIRPQLTDDFAERVRQVGGVAVVYKSTTYSHSDFDKRLGTSDGDQLTQRFKYFLNQCRG